ncbi:hypothetical protein GIB67_003698 [Kingdonia uniflora]|uniref:Amino acid transporter transmembrane domain-containing protein n=1 Tax=Kingdonia uniflora TaxID=39325 RepID=A0A7J7M405_9MAGN|nr:hypothetical protein GIB67_003698 [Kingdonia uniflora]
MRNLGIGNSNTNVDYNTKGSMQDKIFNAFGAIAAIVVCNTSGLLPEIQSTLHKPAIKNMRKALYLQYSAGILIYYGVTIAGYWGYGSLASEYLPKDLKLYYEINLNHHTMLLQVKGKTAKQYQKLWHWSNIVVFSLIAVVTTISAIRLIVNNARMYQFFANT